MTAPQHLQWVPSSAILALHAIRRENKRRFKMCKYCDDKGSRTSLGTLGYDDYPTQVEFSIDDDGEGSIDVFWCAYDDMCGYGEDSATIQVNYCPWCGRKLN